MKSLGFWTWQDYGYRLLWRVLWAFPQTRLIVMAQSATRHNSLSFLHKQMPENFDYFKKTRKSAWNLRDAFDAFKLAAPNLTNEQQLTEFHQLLLKADDSVIKSWLTSWKSFCKKETSARTMQPSTSNPNINVNMQASTNHGFSFGNVTNYSCNNYKKRESTDHELNAPPSKRYL